MESTGVFVSNSCVLPSDYHGFEVADVCLRAVGGEIGLYPVAAFGTGNVRAHHCAVVRRFGDGDFRIHSPCCEFLVKETGNAGYLILRGGRTLQLRALPVPMSVGFVDGEI